MKDALGQEIIEGYAAQVDAGRGASSVQKVYVIGTKGKSVRVLGCPWRPYTLHTLVEDYKAGIEELPEYIKVPTRIIMLEGHQWETS